MLSSGAHMILFFIFRFLIHLGFILVYDVCDLVLSFPNGWPVVPESLIKNSSLLWWFERTSLYYSSRYSWVYSRLLFCFIDLSLSSCLFSFIPHLRVCLLILEREKGREREKYHINVSKKHQSVASRMCPNWGDQTHNLAVCPDWESNL